MIGSTAQDFTFSPLLMRKHRMVDGDKSRYRVYQTNGEFRTIEAKTAYEAFKVSGFKVASRIVRVTQYENSSIHKNEMSEVVETAPVRVVTSPSKTAASTFVAAPPQSGAPVIQPRTESVDTMNLQPMQKPIIEGVPDGIEEISSVSTPVQVKVPNRSLSSQSPGNAPQPKADRTMLSVQDIDKLLGK